MGEKKAAGQTQKEKYEASGGWNQGRVEEKHLLAALKAIHLRLLFLTYVLRGSLYSHPLSLIPQSLAIVQQAPNVQPPW